MVELYQLVLKGHYIAGGPAEYRDRNVYKSKEAITDEHVKKVKEMLLNEDRFDAWTEYPFSERIRAPIKEYIQRLTLVE
ncbi:MAG: hypothetical protein FWG92_08010 [Leptospirales bacterium]|nr:hypothetical protein [Leptospirales bacterium]